MIPKFSVERGREFDTFTLNDYPDHSFQVTNCEFDAGKNDRLKLAISYLNEPPVGDLKEAIEWQIQAILTGMMESYHENRRHNLETF